MYFLETSAKEAENVERLFMEIAAELMEVSKHECTLQDHVIWEHYNMEICHSSKHAARNYLDTKQTPLR